MDQRLTPSNGRVAAIELKGDVLAKSFEEGRWRQCIAPVADILSRPEGSIDCQILFGERFRVLEDRQGWSFGQLARDGYCGYLHTESLGECHPLTHWVNCLSTQVYPKPDIKTRPIAWYPFGARLTIGNRVGSFEEILGRGFVPSKHIEKNDSLGKDPLPFARLFLGVSYLWGGNGPLGIDCSGLVQMVLLVTGCSCPRDADLQWQWMQHRLSPSEVRPGDFAFWDDHVGIIDENDTLIHANAHHMQVVSEPFNAIYQRISKLGESKFLGFARAPRGEERFADS